MASDTVSIVWVLIIIMIPLFIMDIKKLRNKFKQTSNNSGIYFGTNLTVCFGLLF